MIDWTDADMAQYEEAYAIFKETSSIKDTATRMNCKVSTIKTILFFSKQEKAKYRLKKQLAALGLLNA